MAQQSPTETAMVIRRLLDPSEQEIARVIQLLSTAFEGDIKMASLSGGSKLTEREIYRLQVKESLAHGRCYIADKEGTIQGVAVCLAPGHDWTIFKDEEYIKQLSRYQQEWYFGHLQQQYDRLYQAAFAEGTSARYDAWTLQLLGVHPEHRLKGVARALVNVVSTEADKERKPIIAEVQDPSNVTIFKQMGFTYRSVKNFVSPESVGFPLWCMIREPTIARLEA